MSKRKIINDPIYGLISFKHDLIYDLIDHRHFQRLRRISQMGLSTYVYPGANHSRFSHAIGALHLMTTALDILQTKGVKISTEEHLAASIAILLHDIGHGPFSHALEHLMIDLTHEDISLQIMKELNVEYNGQLDTAISIFKGDYPRKFLTELVSGQIDMDRMDYLTRDSYYSGVAEGVIGYKRIIAMLNVHDDTLVVEEKGIFSIEKFLVARHIMYWQVYFHKTSVVSEQMLKKFIFHYKLICDSNPDILPDSSLKEFFCTTLSGKINARKHLDNFLTLDDIDIYNCLKTCMLSSDYTLSALSKGIIHRKLFKIILSNTPIKSDQLENVRQKVRHKLGIDSEIIDDLLIQGQESSIAYDNVHEEIKILDNTGLIKSISSYLDVLVNVKKITKYYLCYPM